MKGGQRLANAAHDVPPKLEAKINADRSDG
jgi:hypothetical protein